MSAEGSVTTTLRDEVTEAGVRGWIAESWMRDAPLLFCADAPVKSSSDAVLQLLYSSMYGEGDLLRHLRFLDYRVSHAQHPSCEYDYRTTNLAVDLRDGVRLCKLVAVMTGDRGVMEAAHVPATARAVRLRNVEGALHAMAAAGLRLGDVRAADVVDGDRAKSLALLWSMMHHWQVRAR